MRKRSSRRNAWPRFPLLHSRAARLGWNRKRRGSRRTRRNAGGSLVSQGSKAVTRGFSLTNAKKAGVILYGNISTSAAANYIQNMVPMLRSHAALDVLSTVAVAGLNGFVTRKLKFASKYSNDVFVGGMLAGVTRLLKAVLPGHFNTCGLGEDMEGLGDWMVSPSNIATARYGTHGIGWAPGPNTPAIGTHGIGDEAVWGQINPPGYMNPPMSPLVVLDGLGMEDEMAGLA